MYDFFTCDLSFHSSSVFFALIVIVQSQKSSHRYQLRFQSSFVKQPKTELRPSNDGLAKLGQNPLIKTFEMSEALGFFNEFPRIIFFINYRGLYLPFSSIDI